MNKFLTICLAVAAAGPAFAQAPGPLDGEWRGRSDGGSCNAPLDFDLTLRGGRLQGRGILIPASA